MTVAAESVAEADLLLELAGHWCSEGMRLGAEYAQAFVETAADVRLDCTVRDGQASESGAIVKRRAGVGLLLRHRGSWWYGSAPMSEPQTLARQLSHVAGFGTPRAPAALDRVRPVGLPPSPWSELTRSTRAADWCAGLGSVRLSLVQDLFSRCRAVVDSRGVCEVTPVRDARQRCTAVVSDGIASARSFTRRTSRRWDSAAELLDSADVLARDAIERASDLLPARPLGQHRTPVVFGPRAGAAFLHELVGHALEADNFANHAAASASLTEGALCDAPLTLLDDPTIADSIGSRTTDDDGQQSRRTTLVDRGTVVEQLTSLRSNFANGDPCTGNGRRQDYTVASLPRATNTVVAPGSDRIADLLGVPAGGLLYIAALSSGETVPSRGDFCFSAAESYLLTPDAGRLPLRDVNLFGDARATLRRLVGIADDVEGDNVTCGKQGQSVLIGLYSPTMRFDHLDWWC